MGLDMYLLNNKDWDQELAYWRKANQIHYWFVKNIQDGKDDCGFYPVTKEKLQKLLDLCIQVKNSSELIKGIIINGYTFKNGKEFPCYEDGMIIKDNSTAENILPVYKGFFFGSYQYDQYYLKDIYYTIDVLTELINNYNFEFGMYYHSSW